MCLQITRINMPQRQIRKDQIVVVEDDPDQWVLVSTASSQAIPDIELIWVKTTDEAMAYLTNCLEGKQPLPKLMLLDLYVPNAELAWQLLQTIRQPGSPFLWMPVVLITNSDHRANINDFYSFGGTSYIVKPNSYERWIEHLKSLRSYWWDTVTLPNNSNR